MSRRKIPKVTERKLGRHQAIGLWHPDGRIEIDPRIEGELRLDVLIHEFSHERHPHWTEEKVSSEATIMAAFLWKNGVRAERPTKKTKKRLPGS